MIVAWLTGRALGLQKWIWLLALLAILTGAVWLLSASEKADDAANQTIGRTEAEATAMAETLDRIETANDAEAQMSASPDARLASCRLHSRTPANCGR